MIVLAVEAVAGAGDPAALVPGLPIWVPSLGLMILLTLTNLLSVRSYGEFEFWFASIKVAAIIAFICLGAPPTRFGCGRRRAGFTQPDRARAASRPNGFGAVLSGVVIVIFSFVGAEIATIAAGRVRRARRAAVTKATNTVIVRVLGLLRAARSSCSSAILPWNATELGRRRRSWRRSTEIGIPGAADVMNAIVLTAVLSCLNSGLYVASRMNFALAPPRRRAAVDDHSSTRAACRCGRSWPRPRSATSR